jgi:hypothetical protein
MLLPLGSLLYEVGDLMGPILEEQGGIGVLGYEYAVGSKLAGQQQSGQGSLISADGLRHVGDGD